MLVVVIALVVATCRCAAIVGVGGEGNSGSAMSSGNAWCGHCGRRSAGIGRHKR